MSTQLDHGDALGVMSKFFQDATVEKALQGMKQIVEDNEKLKKENESLRTTNSQNLKSIAQVEAETEALEENLKAKDIDLRNTKVKKAELEGKLTAAQQEIQSTSEKFSEEMKAKKEKEAKISELEKQLKEEKSRLSSAKYAERKAQTDLEKAQNDLRRAEAERDSKDSQLKKLGKMAVSMEPLADEKMGECLETIFASAYKLADTYLTMDLDDSVLQNPATWEEIKALEAFRKWPFPQSNSLSAKQMRLAAFLTALGHVLQKHIFQATYLVEEPEELSWMLSGLAKKDPERETHLRSVLLAAYTDQEQLKKAAMERIGDVVEDLKCFHSFIPEDSRAAFEDALRTTTCKLACKNWNILLRQPVAIEPCPDPGPRVVTACWRLLPGLDRTPVNGQAASPKLTNGDATPSSAKTDADRRPETPLRRKDIEPIWPGFRSVVGSRSEVLCMGFIIDSAMMAPAHEELEKMNAVPDENFPARSRRQSIRGEKGKASSSLGSGRGSKKAFLPSAGGNAAKSG